MPGTSPDRPPRPRAAGLLGALAVAALGACAGPVRQPGESEVACIHRLYDYPDRAEPFAAAAAACAGNRTVDLTGDRYFQVLASRQNIPFVSHDEPGTDRITLTGSRIPQSTDQPPVPELSLH